MYEFMYFLLLYIGAVYVKGVRNLLKEARGESHSTGKSLARPLPLKVYPSQPAQLASRQMRWLTMGSLLESSLASLPIPFAWSCTSLSVIMGDSRRGTALGARVIRACLSVRCDSSNRVLPTNFRRSASATLLCVCAKRREVSVELPFVL